MATTSAPITTTTKSTPLPTTSTSTVATTVASTVAQTTTSKTTTRPSSVQTPPPPPLPVANRKGIILFYSLIIFKNEHDFVLKMTVLKKKVAEN